MSKFKICFLNTAGASAWGGADFLWYDLARQCVDLDHEVVVSIFDWKFENDGRYRTLADSELVTIHLRESLHHNALKDKVIGKVKEYLIAGFQMKHLDRCNIDLIVVNQGAFSDMGINRYHKYLMQTNIPFVNVSHGNTEDGIYTTLQNRRMKEIYERSQRCFFVSERIRDVAQRQLCLEFLNSEIIRNPVNISETSILPLPDSETINFAMVATLLCRVKGQDKLLECLSKCKWKKRNWHLNIYGSGPDVEYIKNLIVFYRLENKVTLKGFALNVRTDIWAKNHVLLMPSSQEGLPISLVEAFICGRPAVVSNVGGNSEVVEEDLNGYISDSPQWYSFDKALEKFWKNRNSLDTLSQNSHEKGLAIYNEYDPLEIISKLINVAKAAK